MKNIKYILIALVGMLLVTSVSYGQSPRVNMKYNVEIYPQGSGATPVLMYIQVWKGGNINTVTDAWSGYIVPHHIGESESSAYICYNFGSNWDIYSVQIMDNSGGSNNAYIGGGYSSTDDFDYKPYTTSYHYNATFYPMGSHNAGVQLD